LPKSIRRASPKRWSQRRLLSLKPSRDPANLRKQEAMLPILGMRRDLGAKGGEVEDEVVEDPLKHREGFREAVTEARTHAVQAEDICDPPTSQTPLTLPSMSSRRIKKLRLLTN